MTLSALENARKRQKELRASGEYRLLDPVAKLNEKATRKRAIDAMCYQCQGEGADSGWKWAIGNCLVTDCALWRFRPYQRLEGTPAQGVYRGISA